MQAKPFLDLKKLFFISFALCAYSINSYGIIWGADDRQESYTQTKVNQIISPSVALMASPVFLQKKEKEYLINFDSISNRHEVALCKGEKFYAQPTASVNCTGFLVAPNLILTAGHCVTAMNTEVYNKVTPHCRDFLWIFDYKYKRKGIIDSFAPNNNVFKCKEVIYAKFKYNNQTSNEFSGYGDDIALIRLDRSTARSAIILNQNIRSTEKVYTVGYPSGLPQKVTLNGRIKSSKYENFFTTTLDILGGNSGGPVLNRKHEAIGVVVRSFPHEDYIYLDKKQCSIPKTCSLSLKDCKLDESDNFEIMHSHGQKISDKILDLINNENSDNKNLLF